MSTPADREALTHALEAKLHEVAGERGFRFTTAVTMTVTDLQQVAQAVSDDSHSSGTASDGEAAAGSDDDSGGSGDDGAHAGPGVWAGSAVVAEIGGYDGSPEYWHPVKREVAAYAALHRQQLQERAQSLSRLSSAIDRWRANQQKGWWSSDLDTLKETALQQLAPLMTAETNDLARLRARPQITFSPSSIPIAVRSAAPPVGRPKISSSLVEHLDERVPTPELALGRAVELRDLPKLRNQAALPTVVVDGRLCTHDGKYPIDSGGGSIRYVIALEGGVAVLYTDQLFREAGRGPGAEGGGARDVFLGYPTMSSHGQIDGTIVGAGDMRVVQGKIESLTNKSGAWRPGGRNLAATLRLLVRLGVLTEGEIVRKGVTVRQWIGKPDGFNVDDGDLVTLPGYLVAGKLGGVVQAGPGS